jgi:hypothetical protein
VMDDDAFDRCRSRSRTILPPHPQIAGIDRFRWTCMSE